MQQTYLLLSLGIGILGSLSMFVGDMLLYFTPEDIQVDGTLKPFAKIMKRISLKRLWWGGLLGPVSAFMYSIGYFSIYLATADKYKTWGLAIFLIWTVSIFIGGSYHMQFTCYGIVARSEDEKIVDELGKTIVSFAKVYLIPFMIGQVLLAGLIVLGKTIYPAWYIVFSPVLWLVLSVLWPKFPQPYKNILGGGWNNLVNTIFFTASFIAVMNM